MRNLAQYPLTDEECIKVLSELRDSIITEGAMGDIRPLVLQEAINFFKNPFGHRPTDEGEQ